MNVKVCKKCNLQYHDNIRFCGKCGSELETIVITENHNRNNIWEQLQIHKKFIGILLIIIILLIIGYYNYSSKMATDKLGPGSIYAAVKVDGKWGFIDQHGRYYILSLIMMRLKILVKVLLQQKTPKTGNGVLLIPKVNM